MMIELPDDKSELEKKLKEKLREIFQFENEDLDFGIYRIMNYKRKEIEKFIENELIMKIRKELQSINKVQISQMKSKIKELERKIRETLGEEAFENGELKSEFKNTPLGREYYEIKRKLEKIGDTEDLEKQVYNHLINFFSRYYDNGDFISKRRYGKNERYCIPYNGEEVLLYWANRDQYYIKTTEYFRKYTFKVKELKVNFRVVEAEEEKGDIKSPEKKFFVLNERILDFNEDKRELNIYFEYRGLTREEEERYKQGNRVSQDMINKEIIRVLREKISSQNDQNHAGNSKGSTWDKRLLGVIFEKDPKSKTGRSIIEKHLYKYTRRNTSDYFIHKDLKGFLKRELDFYIKNEILKLEDLQILGEPEYFDKLKLYLIAVRTFRTIALKIIDFLAQIEDFQKKLWEKKKFVIQTNYVITLDKIKEYAGKEFLESILDEVLHNKNQRDEWEKLFGVKVEKKEDLYKINVLGEKEWKKLPVDTKYFREEFKWKLLSAISENNDLDEVIDGILIKSENWQALNLILAKYRGKIKTIYIDPPFNSKSTEILYKNNYKHSSWLTLIENRISLSKQFLTNKGVFVVSIDENEQERLGLLIESVFGNYKKTLVTIVHNPSGTQGENFSYTNEFAYFVYPSKGRIIYPEERTEESADIRQFMNTAKGNTINYLRESGPNCFYPILVKNGKIVGFGDVLPLDKHPPSSNVKRDDGIIEVYPIDDEGVERKWVFSRDTVENVKNELFVKYDEKKKKYIIMRIKKLINYKTVWTDSKYSAKRYGTLLLKDMGLGQFTFPKSIWTVYEIIKATARNDAKSIILDFFAGSGTTAHAVMMLNREDSGRRKFILVELADHFERVIIPRIKKVAYSFDWRDGKPQDMNGLGVFFKYQTLEQYEDALENVEFENVRPELYEFYDYIVKYMLDWETKDSNTFLNISKMENPFDYKLKVIENYQQKLVNVDLIETFNYLIGLHVTRYKVLTDNERKYIFVFGEKDSKRIVVVWRSTKDLDLVNDKRFIEENIREFRPDEIYINGDAAVEGFRPIEPLFKLEIFDED